MTYLIGKSAVEDFEKWRSTFQTNESYRSEHGERGYQVFQSVDDPNEVTVLFKWDENKDPRAFFESEQMRKIMAEAGLIGRPDMTVAKLVDHKPAQQPSA